MEKTVLEKITQKSKKLGADRLDILLKESSSISANTRLAKLEEIVQAETIDINLRVFVGKRSAVISTDNVAKLMEDSFLEKAIAAAKNTPEEPEEESFELCSTIKEMDICDRSSVCHEKLIENAQKCEEIALQVDGITNSIGAESESKLTKVTLLKDEDFFGEYEKSQFGISLVTLAEKNGDLQRHYAFSNTVYYSDLMAPEQIAKKAAEQTLRKLGAKKIKSCNTPVIFDREVSSHLLADMIASLNGATVANGASFLKDKLWEKIFCDELNIVDRCSTGRGLRSRPFDSDGIECRDTTLVSNGTLTSFLLNKKYANRLKTKTTGNASGFFSISPNNVCIENGKTSLGELMRDMKSGLYVTEVLGTGLNAVTGNYSQGVVGFWIENGEIAYPVHEITLAGNFIHMFANCIIGSDLKTETGIDAPSILFEEMTVGGI